MHLGGFFYVFKNVQIFNQEYRNNKYNFHVHTVHPHIIKVFLSTNWCTSNLSWKQSTLKLTLKQLRHVSVQSHHNQGAYHLCLLKLQLLNQPIKIHRCVVMWLHILVGPCRCVYVALFGSRPSLGNAPKHVGSCFNLNLNVNFKIVLKTIHLCISWWIKELWTCSIS